MLRGDALWMELYAVNGMVLVFDRHDQPVFGFGGDIKAVGQGVAIDNQGVVAGRFKGSWKSLEDTVFPVMDMGQFAMHQLRGLDYLAAKSLSNALMAKAYPQNWKITRGLFDQLQRYAGLIGGAWSRRNNEGIRCFQEQFFNADRIIAIDADFHTQLTQIVNKVVGKTVIIIDKGYLGHIFHVGRSIFLLYGKARILGVAK